LEIDETGLGERSLNRLLGYPKQTLPIHLAIPFAPLLIVFERLSKMAGEYLKLEKMRREQKS